VISETVFLLSCGLFCGNSRKQLFEFPQKAKEKKERIKKEYRSTSMI